MRAPASDHLTSINDASRRQNIAAAGGATETISHKSTADAYDCVRLVLPRKGSFFMYGECDERPVTIGDAVLIAPGALVGYQPEERVTMPTLFLDMDFLIEQLFWQFLELIPDREAARDLAARLYPDLVQVIHLGEPTSGRLGLILDEIVSLAKDARTAANYFRTHALVFHGACCACPSGP